MNTVILPVFSADPLLLERACNSGSTSSYQAIYSPKAGGYEEYSRIEIMQAAGRAGRPQFDDVGVCVVMTRPEVAARYESILGGSETIESKLLPLEL